MMASPPHILLLVLAALAPLSPGAAPALRPAAASASSATDISSASNPLAGLPALPKVHHSYGMCRPGPPGVMPWLDCALPVDSTSALQVDFARIARLGGRRCVQRRRPPRPHAGRRAHLGRRGRW